MSISRDGHIAGRHLCGGGHERGVRSMSTNFLCNGLWRCFEQLGGIAACCKFTCALDNNLVLLVSGFDGKRRGGFQAASWNYGTCVD